MLQHNSALLVMLKHNLRNSTICRRTDFQIRPVFRDGFGNPSYRDEEGWIIKWQPAS